MKNSCCHHSPSQWNRHRNLLRDSSGSWGNSEDKTYNKKRPEQKVFLLRPLFVQPLFNYSKRNFVLKTLVIIKLSSSSILFLAIGTRTSRFLL